MADQKVETEAETRRYPKIEATIEPRMRRMKIPCDKIQIPRGKILREQKHSKLIRLSSTESLEDPFEDLTLRDFHSWDNSTPPAMDNERKAIIEKYTEKYSPLHRLARPKSIKRSPRYHTPIYSSKCRSITKESEEANKDHQLTTTTTPLIFTATPLSTEVKEELETTSSEALTPWSCDFEEIWEEIKDDFFESDEESEDRSSSNFLDDKLRLTMTSLTEEKLDAQKGGQQDAQDDANECESTTEESAEKKIDEAPIG